MLEMQEAFGLNRQVLILQKLFSVFNDGYLFYKNSFRIQPTGIYFTKTAFGLNRQVFILQKQFSG